MAALSSEAVDSTGTVLTENACDVAGDTIPYGSTAIFRNDDASSTTVTVVTPGSVDGDLAIADRDIEVAAGAVVGVTPNRDYRDPETDLVSFTYSSVTSLTATVHD